MAAGLLALVTASTRAGAEDTGRAGTAGNATPTDALGNARSDDGTATVQVNTQQIVIKSTPDRTPKNIAILAGIAGAGALVGGLALYYHLDARDLSAKVSTADDTNRPWTPALQGIYDTANHEATYATIAYSLGGALLIGAAVGVIVTAPAEETTIIHPHVGAVPTRGGAAVSAAWSF